MIKGCLFVLLLPGLAVAADLGGTWEIQTMGADREVQIRQRDGTIVVHRVMWPVFEGEKYKLEHLYRGRIDGTTIRGDLLVKEEGASKYEILRPFEGSIRSSDEITLDGMTMRRTRDGGASPPPPSEPGPSGSLAPPPRPPKEAGAGKPAATNPNPGAGLFARIMSSPGMEDLFEDALKVEIPKAVAALTREGDSLFDREKFAAALEKYEEASETGGGTDSQLLHRKGRCLLKLRRWADARETLRAALRLDPHNEAIRRDYRKAKRRAR